MTPEQTKALLAAAREVVAQHVETWGEGDGCLCATCRLAHVLNGINE